MAARTITYFALALKAGIIIMILFSFVRMYIVINKEPLLEMNKGMFRTHVLALALYIVGLVAHEVSFDLWSFDTDYQKNIPDTKLTLFAAITLCNNIFSVFLGLLLFYMIAKMTHPVLDEYYDPVLKRHVPFFVYLANCKHMIDHFEHGTLP